MTIIMIERARGNGGNKSENNRTNQVSFYFNQEDNYN